jgi:uncharacterized membrane protein
MDLRNIREIKETSAERLAKSPSQRKIVVIYAALTLGLMALTALLSYVLDLQMDNFGGLSNLSKRTMLSSVQSMLPFAQSLLTMCLDLGYLAAMLRIARGMYTSPQTLRLGFDRFWLLIRCAIFKGLIVAAVAFFCLYFGVMIYMLTPFSNAAVEIVAPLLSQTSVLDASIVIDAATHAALMEAMIPAFVICGLLMLVLGVPVLYSYRMVNYIIIDKPAISAMMALRESKRMMRGNRLALLKLDLSLWVYYAVLAVTTVICYGDLLLPMLGVQLPISEDAAYFVFYGLYLAADFAVLYFLRNRTEVCYALAYDAVKPEQQQDNGVVLGNIFQM